MPIWSPGMYTLQSYGDRVTTINTQVSYVPQGKGLFPWMTLRDNVELPLKIARTPAAERARRAAEWIRLVELEGFEDRYPRQLSGGMEKRGSLARALIADRPVSLMDEPFGALDAQTKTQMQEWLMQLWADFKKTVVFVTHDVDEAILLADRILLMSNGPRAVIAEMVINTLPADRTRHNMHHDPQFYRIRNHLVDFLVNRSKDLQAKGSAGQFDGYEPVLVCPGLQTPVTQ